MKAFTHSKINSGLEFRETLRSGGYAWPGGYPLFLLTSDCEALCFDCAKSEARLIIRAIRDKSECGWRVVACDINYESEIYCAHCGKQIPSAYGNCDEEES